MPWLPLAIGAGLGLLSASEQDKEASEQRKVAASTIAYSPYTGANINTAQASIHPAKYIASTGAGALAGLAAGQGNAAGALAGVTGTPASSVAPVGSATGDSTPYGTSYNLRSAGSGKGQGGEYGYGPAPGTFTSGSGYGAAWPSGSPYWKTNPYRSD